MKPGAVRYFVTLLWYNRPMKRVRLTYEGAYHHGMNRGINGEDIFSGHKNKAQFLDYLEESIYKYKTRVFAYCISVKVILGHYLDVSGYW